MFPGSKTRQNPEGILLTVSLTVREFRRAQLRP